MSVSIHETIEEKLFALAKYGDWMPSASAIVEKALSEYFANERIAETIEEAYDKWRKENP